MQELNLKKFNCFIGGFAIISSLLLTIRQLSPFVGENIIIMGMTIAIFLIGTYYGSTNHNPHHNNKNINPQQKNFFIIANLFGIGLSYIFIDFFNLIIKSLIPNINIFIILFSFLLIIILPIAYYFGKAKIFTNHACMLGILFGSIITPTILMRFAGIAITMFMVFLLFVFVSLESLLEQTFKDSNLNNKNKQNSTYLLLYLLLILVCYYLNIIIENNNFIKTNAYGNYRVISDVNANRKIFSINQSASSMIQQDTHQGFPYIELIKKILFHDLNLINKNILILGAGGFSFTADGNQNNKITYVDLDPDLKDIVTKYFNKTIYGDFQVADAAVFVKNSKYKNQKYAAIVSDVYSSKYVIPSHILNLEYFKNISSILEDGGVAIFNIIANPGLNDDYSKDVDHKIRMVFPSCMSIPLNYYAVQVSNIIYICH